MAPRPEAQMRDNSRVDKPGRWTEVDGLGHVFKMKWVGQWIDWLCGEEPSRVTPGILPRATGGSLVTFVS